MREVEVKFGVPNLGELLAALGLHGIEVSAPVVQDDQAYAPNGWSYGDSKRGVPFARLRSAVGQHLFTLKRPADNELACDEYECVVSDRDAMHHAILAMGFYPTVRIVKARRMTTLGNGVSLCVDDVEGLGAFIEVERLVTPHVSVTSVQDELARFVAGLGVGAERTNETYDSLLHAATLDAG